MTDFFDDLERQLVAATPTRDARLRRARRRRAGATLGAVAVLLAGGAGIAAAVGDGGAGGPNGAPASSGATTAATATAARTVDSPPAPRSFTIAILNGTTTPGLARSVATRLQGMGYKIGNVTNAAAQDRTDTAVYYRSPACIPAAQAVAFALRLADASGTVAVRPEPRGVRVVAGDRADVVVLAGADQRRPAGP